MGAAGFSNRQPAGNGGINSLTRSRQGIVGWPFLAAVLSAAKIAAYKNSLRFAAAFAKLRRASERSGDRSANFLTVTRALVSLTSMNSLNRYADPAYCLMRLIVGLMFACHGLQLVFGMFGGMPGSDKAIMQVGGWIQLVGGLLVAFGLLTRLAALICSGEMAVAYFMFHVATASTPEAKFFPILNHGELAVFYWVVFFFMVFYGAGCCSIDTLWCKGREAAAPTSTA